jgi:hypothetical protein
MVAARIVVGVERPDREGEIKSGRKNMAQSASQKSNANKTGDEAPSKKQLQRQMARTRESVAETVEEIKETVSEQVAVAKQTVAGVLDYREEFQKEPLVWSLGALSAGFALGYTMGYAHKETKGKNKSQVSAFTNSLVDELSVVGNNLVMPALNSHIKELFGFDFAGVLASISKQKKSSPKRKPAKKSRARKAAKKSRKKAA